MSTKEINGMELSDDGKTLIRVNLTVSGVFAIPEGVTTVSYGAFNGCEHITTLVIPASVTFFGIDAFRGCVRIKHVMYEGTKEQWFDIDFNTQFSNPLVHGATLNIDGFPVVSLTIPTTVTRIRRHALRGCDCLTWVDIPSSVEVIEHGAFASCPLLEEIRLHTGLRTIGENAFSWCPSLRQIELPLSVYEIEQHAFAWSGALAGLYIPKTVEQVGTGIALGNVDVEFYCEGDPNQKWWSGTWNKVNPKARTSTGKTTANCPRWWYEQNVVNAPGI